MTDAEKAYAAAERMIAKAKRDGDEDLDFNGGETQALEELPPSIAELSGLVHLNFNSTRLTDAGIAPLRNLPHVDSLLLSYTPITEAALSHINTLDILRILHLNETQISDIRPLRDFASKAAASDRYHLAFDHCTAAKSDERIAAISMIKRRQGRAQALLDLIDAGWVPPGDVVADAPLAPGYVLPPDGPMRSQDSAPLGGDEDQ
ncbi:leucine-rich repeat domain-containing protein [Pseudorhodobacter aquimaris]|uniref:leucine-rich repeat domain-containing protein n=1 Tax=Pseudorhodobacter aquimaris TaxID=687412 RepID=UPI00067BA34C|nr:leucine-rich repeat domain-containing protein [Pseudorhodobacter aquimaris]